MADKTKISSFYKFASIEWMKLPLMQTRLIRKAQELDLNGLIILAAEGINGTIAGEPEAVSEYLVFLSDELAIDSLPSKNSEASFNPYKKLKIKIREEIVTTGNKELRPSSPVHNHLTPEEWHALLSSEEEDVLVLDVRNYYETALGRFRGAVLPPIRHFSEFGTFVEQTGIPKQQKVLMYCTGGIRCEKAILEMEQQGYEQVYQLEGGILAYLEKFPGKEFDGECFVFDNRVAVDQELEPTEKFQFCPECGQPAPKNIGPEDAQLGCLSSGVKYGHEEDCPFKSL